MFLKKNTFRRNSVLVHHKSCWYQTYDKLEVLMLNKRWKIL